MPRLFRLTLLLLVLTPPALAEGIDLNREIAPGKWLLTYQRTGEIKPLHLKRDENGSSETCIAGDARDKIIDWVSGKGCRVESETYEDGVYRLAGECRLKFWKAEAIPVNVELKPESTTRFKLHIQTRDNALLGYTEQTEAEHVGPCDPPSTGQPEQDQAAEH